MTRSYCTTLRLASRAGTRIVGGVLVRGVGGLVSR